MIWSQIVHHEPHVVVDQERRRARVGDLPEPLAENLALVRVESRRRLVQAKEPRLHRDRPRDSDELSLSLGQLRRHRLGDAGRGRAARARRSAAALSPMRFPTSSAARARNDGRWAATVRFSLTVRSSNSSVLCQVRASPRRARACGGSPARSRPSSSTRPRGTDEAGDRVDERRLAGAVRPDQPDQLPLLDADVDGVDGPHAPEADRKAGRGEDGAHVPLRDPTPPSSVFRFAARLRRPVERAGHALGVLDQREDEHEAAEEEEPVPRQAEPLVERVREESLRGDRPAKTAPETSVIPPV